jgi:hypothetical protein
VKGGEGRARTERLVEEQDVRAREQGAQDARAPGLAVAERDRGRVEELAHEAEALRERAAAGTVAEHAAQGRVVAIAQGAVAGGVVNKLGAGAVREAEERDGRVRVRACGGQRGPQPERRRRRGVDAVLPAQCLLQM